MQKIRMVDEAKDGYAAYRCAMCELVTFKINAKLSVISLARLLTEDLREVDGVPREIVHHCETGCCGIATIIGIATEHVVMSGATDSDEMVN